jgi:hypothetical protein
MKVKMEIKNWVVFHKKEVHIFTTKEMKEKGLDILIDYDYLDIILQSKSLKNKTNWRVTKSFSHTKIVDVFGGVTGGYIYYHVKVAPIEDDSLSSMKKIYSITNKLIEEAILRETSAITPMLENMELNIDGVFIKFKAERGMTASDVVSNYEITGRKFKNLRFGAYCNNH